MAVDTNVAVVALLVSLIALVISTTQLLQQVFGTALGYRQCNPSIIGPWSKTRRRVFHFRELRLETPFQTPEFALTSTLSSCQSPAVDGTNPDSVTQETLLRARKQERLYLIDGTTVSRQLTYASTVVNDAGPGTDDNSTQPLAVGWLTLLRKIHDHEARYKVLQPNAASALSWQSEDLRKQVQQPAIKRIQRSWDFMPAEALRPLASAQLGALLKLCYRLGLGWYDLQLGRKSLRAEGHGHSFTQIEIGGLGYVLEYRFSASDVPVDARHPASRHFVPPKEASMMAFGRIPVSRDIGIPLEYFDVGKEDYNLCMIDMLAALRVDAALLEEYRKHLTRRTLRCRKRDATVGRSVRSFEGAWGCQGSATIPSQTMLFFHDLERGSSDPAPPSSTAD